MMMHDCSSALDRDEKIDSNLKEIDSIIEHHRGKPGALIPVLEQIQNITGYLPESIQRRVAKGLNLPLSQVYGVVTFYSFFTMKPKGRHQLKVCLGTACHVRGGQAIIDRIKDELGIEPGEITTDREFSLDVVRCLGACGLAPVVMIDQDTHRQVKPVKINKILESYGEKA